MNEAFKRILDDAIFRIDESDKKARDAAVQAKKDLRAVAEFAETLPHRILDTMSVFATGEFNFEDGRWYSTNATLNVGGHSASLEGGFRTPMKGGKYRAIVILQKME